VLGELKVTKKPNLTNGYPYKNNNNKVKSKPLELFELAGKNHQIGNILKNICIYCVFVAFALLRVIRRVLKTQHYRRALFARRQQSKT
jgi:hypothetical protein